MGLQETGIDISPLQEHCPKSPLQEHCNIRFPDCLQSNQHVAVSPVRLQEAACSSAHHFRKSAPWDVRQCCLAALMSTFLSVVSFHVQTAGHLRSAPQPDTLEVCYRNILLALVEQLPRASQASIGTSVILTSSSRTADFCQRSRCSHHAACAQLALAKASSAAVAVMLWGMRLLLTGCEARS